MSARQRSEFDTVLAAAVAAPDDGKAWDRLEDLAGKEDRPDEVAAAYRDALRDAEPALADRLGRRAVRFAEEWFGQDSDDLADILARVVGMDPRAEWAFQRLSVVYTVKEQWADLLALYDRAIAASAGNSPGDQARQIKLLDEAYQAAKDMAGDATTAIGYLSRLYQLDRKDKHALALERLLEKNGRWRELIDLWDERIELVRTGRAALRVKIAGTWLDQLDEPGRALETLRLLFAEPDRASDDDAGVLLERVLTAKSASAATRDAALELLRSHLESSGRGGDVVRLIEAALPFAAPERRKEMHLTAASRLAEEGRHAAALEHWASLLQLDPGMAKVQQGMRQAAQAGDQMARYAEAIVAAAARATDPARKVALLADAARTRLEALDDDRGAIELYQEALGVADIPRADVLTIGRRLDQALARAGRGPERLAVLERLVEAETVTSSKRALIGDVARLAEELGEVDRALSAWRRRLDGDANDAAALAATIDLLDRDGRHRELVEALERRVATQDREGQRRADLVRIAQLSDRELGDPAAAIAAYGRIKSELGADDTTIAALVELFDRTRSYPQLAELLEEVTSTGTALLGEQLSRLGDAYRVHLGSPTRALACYRRALDLDLSQRDARLGLVALLEEPDCRIGAATALGRAYRSSGDWPSFLSLTEARMASASTNDEALRILREVAQIEERLGQPGAALATVCRTLPYAPKDRALEQEMIRLARRAGQFELATRAYEEAAAALTDDPHGAAQLYERQAALLEEIGELPEALKANLSVLAVDPGKLNAAAAVIRLGARLGKWPEAATAVVECTRSRNRIETTLVREIEAAAKETQSFDDAVRTLGAAVEQAGLEPPLASELYLRLADWHRYQRNDDAGAEAALRRATTIDPSRVDALRSLVSLQRKQPGPALLATLERLTDADPRDLDAVHEAAELAVINLGDREISRARLNALLGRATAAWRGTAPATSSRPPAELAEWAVNRLVDLYAGGDRADANAALDLLVDASRMPFPPDAKLALRHRAATIAVEILADDAVAIDMYRSILGQKPDDGRALAALAALYRKQDRVADLLALRQLELHQSTDPARRIELRLEVSRLIDEIDRRGGRLELLRANLGDQPGHGESLAAVTELLAPAGRYRELTDLLSEQARRLESLGRPEEAARLWQRTAELSERELNDTERSIAALRKVMSLGANPETLDMLVRLHLGRGEPAEAVHWLERGLVGAEPARKADVSLRLARAQVQAGRADRAQLALERAIAEGAGTEMVRLELGDLYRAESRWEPLARLLTDSLPYSKDDGATAAFAREAAEIYHQRLGTPEHALPALTRALELVPEDKTLRGMMARTLRAVGKHGESRAMLEALIGDYGRRRTKERAVLHIELAQVLRAEGNLDEALKELEQASQMDVGNPHTLRLLAELANDSGKLDQAERGLRALLLLVRRQPPGDDLEAAGVAEVSYELSVIARRRDDEEKAAELLESALEAARQSDAETIRLRRALVRHDQGALLLDLLEGRLGQTTDPAMKVALSIHAAETLDEQLGRPAEALDRLLTVLGIEPGRIDLHEKARAVAQRAGQLARYVSAATELLARLRRKDESTVLSRLAGELGQTAETELGDLRRARELYEVAHKNSEDPTLWLFAIARVCGELGDSDGRLRALDELAAMATDDAPTPAHADALYRLAQVQVESPELLLRGLALVERALKIDPRPAQAATLLRRAAETAPSSAAVLDLYETVARQSGDPALLLDYLERRIPRGGAELSVVREAVDLAESLGQPERADRLLVHAAAAAREGLGLGSAVWIALRLARLRVAQGNLYEARDLMLEIADHAAPADLQQLGLAIAGAAAGSPDVVDLAIEVYEALRERDPRARAVWQPLAELYRSRGEHARLSALVSDTLPGLMDRNERNALRLTYARYLMGNGRHGDASEILREALLDDPDALDAAALLEEALIASDDQAGLADFLAARFEEAKGRGNADVLTDVALRLGALHDRMESGQAFEIYLDALRYAPNSAPLLRAVVAAYDPADLTHARAQHMERLLAVEEPERAGPLALSLAGLWEVVGDEDRALIALQIGLQRGGEDRDLHDRLETWYREHAMWRELAQLVEHDAERAGDPAAALALFREAAGIYLDNLEDLGRAAQVLDRARALSPDDVGLVLELARLRAAAGDTDAAIVALGQALDGERAPSDRLRLRLARAELLMALGRDREALADLEDANRIDPEEAGDAYRTGLDGARVRAFERGDRDTERDATLRLARLLIAAGQDIHARDLLVHWIDREPSDAEPLYVVRDMDLATERWDGVTGTLARLVLIETGPAQIASAIQLADAAERAGMAAHAQAGLEHVHRAQPEAIEVRDLLRRIYQQAGAWRELSALLLADAQHATDEVTRYQCYRQAADLLVNKLGDTGAAVEPAQKARELRPDDHETQILVSDLHIASGQIQEAVEVLLPAIEAQKRRSPELAALQLRMARAAAATGDKETQLAWLKRAFDVDRKDGTIAAELAQLATEIGDYDLALKPLRAITLNDSQGPITRVMALLWEAKIEHARGNKAKAELWAKKALREDPQFAEAEEFLTSMAAEP